MNLDTVHQAFLSHIFYESRCLVLVSVVLQQELHTLCVAFVRGHVRRGDSIVGQLLAID